MECEREERKKKKKNEGPTEDGQTGGKVNRGNSHKNFDFCPFLCALFSHLFWSVSVMDGAWKRTQIACNKKKFVSQLLCSRHLLIKKTSSFDSIFCSMQRFFSSRVFFIGINFPIRAQSLNPKVRPHRPYPFPRLLPHSRIPSR